MSPSYNDSNDPRHGTPQTHSFPSNGYDLLSSLVSPTSTTAAHSDPAWPPGLQGWDTSMQSFFGSQAMQFPDRIPFTQPGFLPGVQQQQDYIPLGDDAGGENGYGMEVEEEADEGEINETQPQQVHTTQAALVAQTSPLPTNATEEANGPTSKAESRKKLMDLRAKLLANRPRSSTPSKSKGLSIQSKDSIQGQVKENGSNGNKGHGNHYTTAQEEPGMNADIDILLAEGRSAANGNRQAQPEQVTIPKVEEGTAIDQTPTTFPHSTTLPGTDLVLQDQNGDPNMSSDEEGEIIGEPVQPTSPDHPYKSVESRQDTTTEAQEKLDRQLETKSVYGALKEDNSKTAKSSAKGSKEAPKPPEGSRAKPVSPKSKREYLNAAQGRGAAYDSYKPSRGEPIRDGDLERRTSGGNYQMQQGTNRRDDFNRNGDQERRASADDVQRQQDTIRRLKDLLSVKDQEIDELVKREKDNILRQQASRRPSQNTTQAENGTEETAEATLIKDRDIADWLEMTEYNDEEYRQRRLLRFRKKQELDAARAELEREDQMDLEERTHRAHTAVSPPAFSKVQRRASIAAIANPSRMPPPPLPLPLRESNNDRIGDIAPLSQASTPTLKRHHAELDTDVQPAEKFVRTTDNGIRTRGSSPANSFKGEPLSARFPPRPPPLEDRMTRRGSDFERRNLPRRRSPSPGYPYRRADSGDRRRSYSPRPRIRGGLPPPLALERPYQKPCFKCNQTDHQQKDCPLLRRDSRDDPPGGPGFPVSQNYKGKNPRPIGEVKNGNYPPDKQLPY